MIRLSRSIGVLILIVVATAAAPSGAQPPVETPVERQDTQPPAAPVPPPEARPPWVFARPVFRMGGTYVLGSEDTARDVFVLTGDSTIEGWVFGDVVIVAGTTRLLSTARVDGSFIVIGGEARIASGAQVHQDVVVVGAELEEPGDFMPGGSHIVMEPAILGGRLDALVPWVTQGLLWGRPIVPGLEWVWGVVAIFFLAYLALSLLFDRPVRACAETLTHRPLSCFLIGLLVLVLSGPVLLLLTFSVVGVVGVPFAICALLLAWILGKVGVARWIGSRVIPEHADEGGTLSLKRTYGVRSFVLGFAVLCVAYMIPVLGLIAWTTVGVLGLGAASLAFISGYRRENPTPPRPVRTVPIAPPEPPAPVAPSPAAYAAAHDMPLAGPGPVQTIHEEPPMSEFTPTADQPIVPPVPPVAGPYNGGTALLSFPYAAFRDRLAAFMLDVILTVLTAALLDLAGRHTGQRILMLLLLYHIGFWTWKGTTVGGIICQLRLVRVNGEPLRFVDALVRGLSGILSLAVLGLGGFWILKDPERQAWHDKVAGTYVVKVPRHYPL